MICVLCIQCVLCYVWAWLLCETKKKGLYYNASKLINRIVFAFAFAFAFVIPYFIHIYETSTIRMDPFALCIGHGYFLVDIFILF